MQTDPSSSSKKQRTRKRILENAIALFRAEGVRATRLSTIAQKSDVSPATLFNYFPAKGALAEAWVRGELESTLAEATREAVAQKRSLRVALRTVAASVAEATAAEPAVRMEAWAHVGRGPDLSGPGTSGRARTELVSDLVLEQQREHVRGDVSAEALADLLLDAIEGGLIRALSAHAEAADASTLAGVLRTAAQARIDLFLDGARKRNERVRLPARSR